MPAHAPGRPAASRDEIRKRMAAAGAGPADDLDLETLTTYFVALAEMVRSNLASPAPGTWLPGRCGRSVYEI
jgi:hypothetical protein